MNGLIDFDDPNTFPKILNEWGAEFEHRILSAINLDRVSEWWQIEHQLQDLHIGEMKIVTDFVDEHMDTEVAVCHCTRILDVNQFWKYGIVTGGGINSVGEKRLRDLLFSIEVEPEQIENIMSHVYYYWNRDKLSRTEAVHFFIDTLRSYTYATYFDADGNLLEINTEGAAQVPEGYENAGRVVANSNSQEDSYFTDGGFEMVEGNPITTETGSQVLIHEKFAQRNGLSVGDTMLLGNVEDKDKTIPVTVAGIFTNTEEQDSIGMAPSYDLYDNIVFTDLSTASFLLYGTEGTTNVQYGDFYVNDPDELERIMTDVQELDGVDWESCTLTRYDNDYQNAKESLEGLQNIVFIAIAVVSVICFLVLALFLTLRLRGRIHETGVYLAMGISKGSVLLQYLLEVILVAAIALVISFGTSTAISHQIGSSLLSQVTSETYETVDLTGESEAAEEPTEDLGLAEIEVAVSAEDYALVWAFGIVLCVASTALAAYPIMKMKPKSILSQMS